MTTQSQQCHQCSHYKKSYGLCSNSILDVRCELIGTKFAQNIEHRHARGNVQQYYQNLVMERNSDDTEYRTQAFPDVMFESITKFALYTKVLNKLDE